MLPLLAILFVAQSAFAAPSIGVSLVPANRYQYAPDNNRLVNSFIIDGSAAYFDSGEIPLYAQLVLTTVNDMANSQNIGTQASAVISAISILGELASGYPGDACEPAALINAYGYSASTGNKGGFQQALGNYVNRLSSYIDRISQLVINPSSVKFSTGPQGSCLGGGRSYQFEDAWDGILSNASPYDIEYWNELYCFLRRMYNSSSVTSNNVAAAATVAAIPQVGQLSQLALNDLANFLRVVASGGNPTASAAQAKSSLSNSVPRISY